AEDLELDVAAALDKALEVHVGVPERLLGFEPRRLERAWQIAGRSTHPHALAAATSSGLEHHGEADGFGLFDGLLDGLHRSLGPRNPIHTQRSHGAASGDLVAHEPEDLRVRAPRAWV